MGRAKLLTVKPNELKDLNTYFTEFLEQGDILQYNIGRVQRILRQVRNFKDTLEKVESFGYRNEYFFKVIEDDYSGKLYEFRIIVKHNEKVIEIKSNRQDLKEVLDNIIVVMEHRENFLQKDVKATVKELELFTK